MTNLLEKAGEIAALYEKAQENNAYSYTLMDEGATHAPAICRALLDAMEEMEKCRDSNLDEDLGGGEHDDLIEASGIELALSILRRHLGAE
jgi:hypothetical protein